MTADVCRGATASAYDAVALDYERRFVDELDAKLRDRELLDDLAGRGRGVVLDLGCGPGHIGDHVRRHGRPVIGADLSVAQATRAAARLDAVIVADAVALPFDSSTVHDVVAFYSLFHLPRVELPTALRELVRVLHPGGRAILAVHEGEGERHVTDFLGHEVSLTATFYGLDELREMAEGSGLCVVCSERRPPYPNEGSTARIHLVCERPGSGVGERSTAPAGRL